MMIPIAMICQKRMGYMPQPPSSKWCASVAMMPSFPPGASLRGTASDDTGTDIEVKSDLDRLSRTCAGRSRGLRHPGRQVLRGRAHAIGSADLRLGVGRRKAVD